MEKEYVSITTAKIAKEKKFELVPTQSQLQKWLRNKHNIYINISSDTVLLNNLTIEERHKYHIRYLTDDSIWCKSFNCDKTFNKYELALEDALYEGLNLIPLK